MNIEHELAQMLSDRATDVKVHPDLESVTQGAETASVVAVASEPRRLVRVAVVAAALVVAILGLTLLRWNDPSTTTLVASDETTADPNDEGVVTPMESVVTGTNPPPGATFGPVVDKDLVGDAVLFEPDDQANISVLERALVNGSLFEPAGAVVSPDGTVFGLHLYETEPFDFPLPTTYEERTVAGLKAWAFIDGSAPQQIRRGIEIGCATVEVTTGEEAMWSVDLETLVGSLAMSGAIASLTLPEGWRSLGVGGPTDQYQSTVVVSVDESEYRLFMRQAVGRPVGFYLLSNETNPVDLGGGRGSLWHIAGATTPSYNSIVGLSNDTVFNIGGDAPLDVILGVVNSMHAVNEDSWLNIPTSPHVEEPSAMTVEPGRSLGCDTTQLEIIE